MLDSEKQYLINKHLDLVLEKNQVLNLTRITDKEKAQDFHINDSLAAVKIINKLPQGEIVDLGSGPGYPGIPLAISTGRKTTLVESVGKKADCLKYFVSELGLEPLISVSNIRIEDFTLDNINKFQIVTARALSSLSSILELAAPLLKINGYLICYKGLNLTEELNNANKIVKQLGMSYIETDKYILENTQTEHQLVIYKKNNDSKIKLPRRVGLAQNKPLS